MKNWKKKGISALLSLLLALLLVPTTALAAELTGSLDLSSYGSTNASGDGWSWDASTLTLTLTDLSIVGDGTGQTSGIIFPSVASNSTFNIVLVGDNDISGFYNSISEVSPVYRPVNLNISGSGSLTISDCTYLQNGTFYDITIDNTTVTASATNGFIVTTFTICNGADVNLTATGSSCPCIYAVESVTISGSDVTLATTDYWGIVSGTSGTADTTISNSTITVNSAAGIYSSDDLTLVGDVKILTSSNRQVLYAASDLYWDEMSSASDIQGYARVGSYMYYLTDYTLTDGFNVASGRTLTIPENVTLTLGANVTLSADDEGAIINNGAIIVPCNEDNDGGVAAGSLSAGSNEPVDEHVYGDPTFDWSEDGTGCTVSFACENCDDVQKIIATVTLEEENDPTCTQAGTALYTAEAEFDGETYTDTLELTVPATGHSYEEPVFMTSGDGTSCTAIFFCPVCGEELEVEATMTEVSRTAATCIETEIIQYTVSAELDGETYASTLYLTGAAATGHSYGAPVFTWSEDGKTCTATFTCEACGDEQTVTATVTSAVKTAATTSARGVTTYTATVVFDGTEYTDTLDLSDIAQLSTSTSSNTGSSDTDSTSTSSPETGDSSNLLLWTALLLVSAAGVAGLVVLRRKKTK